MDLNKEVVPNKDNTCKIKTNKTLMSNNKDQDKLIIKIKIHKLKPEIIHNKNNKEHNKVDKIIKDKILEIQLKQDQTQQPVVQTNNLNSNIQHQI